MSKVGKKYKWNDQNVPVLLYYSSILMTFIYYLWLAQQIPYTHDDWDWGLMTGLRHLVTADINSRYAGNLLEVLLTRSASVKTLVLGLVFTAIPILICEISIRILMNAGQTQKYYDKSKWMRISNFLLANVLILSMRQDMWRQTYGWIAGFSNFVFSGLCLLLYWDFVLRISAGKKNERHFFYYVISLLFGIIIQLFLENVSIYFLFSSSLICCVCFCRKKRIPLRLLALWIGNIIGFVLMFSSNIYDTLWNTGKAVGGYRKLVFKKSWPVAKTIRKLFKRYCYRFIPKMTSKNSLIIACIALLLFLLSLLFRKKFENKVLQKHINTVCILVNAAFTLLYGGLYFTGYSSGKVLSDWENIISKIDLVFIGVLFFEFVIYFSSARYIFSWLLFFWLSGFFVMVPMVIINTVGPRSYLTSNYCFISMIVLLMGTLWKKLDKNTCIGMTCIFLAFTIVTGGHYSAVYYAIGKKKNERNVMIKEAINGVSDYIYFEKYPNSDYLWYPDPMAADRVEYFRRFYNIPEGVNIHFESWDESD